MNINKNCRLFLNQSYSYDISACHYTILKSLNCDISHLDKDHKEKRNIQIGKMMRDNPKLVSILHNTTNSIIDEYILRNKLNEDDIIIRQYDGIITSKILKVTTDQYIPLELKNIFNVFLISSDRKTFISTDNKEFFIKGISNKYDEMDEVYKKILKINFSNKSSIFIELEKIKKDFFDSTNPRLFCIPVSDNKYNIFLKSYGMFEMSETMVDLLDPNDIDKKKYFDHYIKTFVESIVIEFI